MAISNLHQEADDEVYDVCYQGHQRQQTCQYKPVMTPGASPTQGTKLQLQTFISEVADVTNNVVWAWTNRKWVMGNLCQPTDINLCTTGRAAMS